MQTEEEILKIKKVKNTAVRTVVLRHLLSLEKAQSLKDIENALAYTDRSSIFRTLKTFEENKIIHSIEDGSGMTKYADYYFILYNNKPVGNFRIFWNEDLPGLDERLKSVKLHRLYLHPDTQGKGIGKTLVKWLENKALLKQYNLLWLDAMNEKKQAFSFYKKLGYKYHSHYFLDFELLFDKYRKMSQLYKKL